MKNYYDVLGVKQTASTNEIKSAYLKLIKKYHPDAFDGEKEYAEQKTAEITEAYTTLKDESLKRRYDEKNGFNQKVKTTTVKSQPNLHKKQQSYSKPEHSKPKEQPKTKTTSQTESKEQTKKEKPLSPEEKRAKVEKTAYNIVIILLIAIVILLIVLATKR